jgi:hypothetical protein
VGTSVLQSSCRDERAQERDSTAQIGRCRCRCGGRDTIRLVGGRTERIRNPARRGEETDRPTRACAASLGFVWFRVLPLTTDHMPWRALGPPPRLSSHHPPISLGYIYNFPPLPVSSPRPTLIPAETSRLDTLDVHLNHLNLQATTLIVTTNRSAIGEELHLHSNTHTPGIHSTPIASRPR